MNWQLILPSIATGIAVRITVKEWLRNKEMERRGL